MSSASAAAPSERDAVVRVLQDSAAAWSRDDLGGFMQSYENAPATTYLNSKGVVHGFDAIRAMYAARFAGKPGAMGQLSLTVMDVRPLGPDYALCLGRFSLAAASLPGGTATGIFTLVFHLTPDGWKIVSDHTSS